MLTLTPTVPILNSSNDQIEDNNEEIAELRQRIENIRKQAADLS